MKYLILIFFLVGLTPTVHAAVDVSPEEAADLVAQGLADIIDVRERSELEATGMAEPALWLAKSN